MRYIRYAFLASLGVILISMSLANRGAVELRLMPDAIAGLVGFNPSISLPLFVVILGGIAAGLVIGFVWEWLREYKYRAEATRQTREARRLEREVSRLKTEKTGSRDEVLALLEDGR